MKKKKVQVKEGDLVTLMENIVNEAVKAEKVKWIAEQKAKEGDKISMLESMVKELSGKVEKLSESK